MVGEPVVDWTLVGARRCVVGVVTSGPVSGAVSRSGAGPVEAIVSESAGLAAPGPPLLIALAVIE
jgi:hypothetical protein